MSINIEKSKFDKVVPKSFTYSVSQDASGTHRGTDETVIKKAIADLPEIPEAG